LNFNAVTRVGGGSAPPDIPATITVRRGDAQANGNVNVTDAMFIAQYLAGIRGLGNDTTTVNAVNAASVRQDPTADQITISGGTLAVTNDAALVANQGVTLGAATDTINVSPTKTLTINGAIAGAVGSNLTMTGTGTLILGGISNITTTTFNAAGTLDVNVMNLGAEPMVISGNGLIMKNRIFLEQSLQYYQKYYKLYLILN